MEMLALVLCKLGNLIRLACLGSAGSQDGFVAMQSGCDVLCSPPLNLIVCGPSDHSAM
jgi:hypothetical protein